jgi:hypothetical protein
MAETLCEFELKRKANIARNLERMQARARGSAQPQPQPQRQRTTLFPLRVLMRSSEPLNTPFLRR